MNYKNLLSLAKVKKADFLDIKFVDLIGRWHHITLPITQLGQKLFSEGVGIDGSSVSGFSKVKAGDMILIPAPETAFFDPFFSESTISMIGDVIEIEVKREGFSRDPRWVAQKAEKFLQKTKIAEKSLWGPEFEFYLFDKVRYGESEKQSYYFGEAKESEGENLGYQIGHKGGYHIAPPQDQTYNLRTTMCKILKECGVPVKYHHHEVGGAGQEEIEVMFDTLTKMADRSMLTKYVIKNTAVAAGKSVTFMPKPLFNEPGNGMHVHQYLARKGRSIFYDARRPAHLSEVAQWYLGGLLTHAPALLAFTNPSTNSYKRLIPGFEAPVRLAYSVGNRTAAIRIPGYITEPTCMRVEFRPPDATANPYLAFAAMLMAGLDGIKRKIDPGEPFDKDIFSLSEKDLKEIPMLPTSLEQALDALEKDHQFLKRDEVFTDDLLETWIKLKRIETEELRLRPHPYEFHLYYAQ
ncbi:MAG: type I glutamate--ammonia ligase [Candidatus Edwardsbacteria bacterium]